MDTGQWQHLPNWRIYRLRKRIECIYLSSSLHLHSDVLLQCPSLCECPAFGIEEGLALTFPHFQTPCRSATRKRATDLHCHDIQQQRRMWNRT